jgi:hypothetical protein
MHHPCLQLFQPRRKLPADHLREPAVQPMPRALTLFPFGFIFADRFWRRLWIWQVRMIILVHSPPAHPPRDPWSAAAGAFVRLPLPGPWRVRQAESVVSPGWFLPTTSAWIQEKRLLGAFPRTAAPPPLSVVAVGHEGCLPHAGFSRLPEVRGSFLVGEATTGPCFCIADNTWMRTCSSSTSSLHGAFATKWCRD